MQFVFLFMALMVLMPCSKELPIERFNEKVPNRDRRKPSPMDPHNHESHAENSDNYQNGESISGTEGKDEWDETVSRSNHSRMLAFTSTLGYDDWWFLTTRRPRLSLKDFPGKPGVATWKEISPNSSGENRKSRKISGPTAAGVSSDSLSIVLNHHFSQKVLSFLLMSLLVRSFCWT